MQEIELLGKFSEAMGKTQNFRLHPFNNQVSVDNIRRDFNSVFIFYIIYFVLVFFRNIIVLRIYQAVCWYGEYKVC